MMFNLADLFQAYLVPFVIAVPIGLLLIFLGLRNGGGERVPDIVEPAPVAGQAETAVSVDIPTERTGRFDAIPGGHGVSISPGGGIDLPLSPHEKTQVIDLRQSGEPGSGAPAHKITILVVDDSAVPRAKLRKLFETQGYEVVTANDGVQALEELSRNRFSVVITDLEMPNMNGIELIAAIQGSLETEDIPVIAITGHEDMQARVHDIRGLFGIFKKPWNDRELLKRVDVLAAIRK
jgi:CheY-like chemotaxis protein